MNKSEAAFFDLDHTIVAESTETVFGKYLLQSKKLRTIVFIRIILSQLQYQFLHKGDYNSLKRHIIRAVFKDAPAEEYAKLYEKCCREKLFPKIYSEAQAAIDYHRLQRRKLFIISAAMNQGVAPFGKHLQCDGYYAAKFETCNGVLTGEIEGTIFHGRAKGDIVQKIAKEFDLDLAQSYAYGNHINDKYMLACTGHPVAVNPEQNLRRLAMKRGWKIERWNHLMGHHAGKSNRL